jgi:MFS transporter, putative metabolite:H+ symporter
LTYGIKIDHGHYARSNPAVVQTPLHTLIKSVNIRGGAAAENLESAQQAATIAARFNRLPASRYTWQLIALLSLCGFFEIYEIALTSTLSPGLIRAGVFNADAKGLFGLTDQASFAAATFLGLFIGTSSFAAVADRLGRRAILVGSLTWYVAATAVMAAQSTALSVDLWRLISGVGVGVQLVTIDSYIAEWVPKDRRGKAFAINYGLMYLAVPVAALLSWLLLPRAPLGITGWRYAAAFPLLATAVAWWVYRVLPESPRWLLQQGRLRDAERLVSTIESRVRREIGGELPQVPPVNLQAVKIQEGSSSSGFAELFRPPYLRRTGMLLALNIFQALGFYGFSNWVPALLTSQGVSFIKSLQYSFVIAIVYPMTPLLCAFIADRIERKWMIVIGATGTAVFGLLFAQQSAAAQLVLFGALVTVSNIVLSYSYHAYQTELYPTRIRARAVGFVYSFSRLATVLSGFAIAIALRDFGTTGVFVYIASCMLVVVIAVGAFGPRTRGLTLEEASH